MTTMKDERLRLGRAESVKYFAPVAFCGYIALICGALVVTSAFLQQLQHPAALAVVGALGCALAAALGYAFLLVQLRELRYQSVRTPRDALDNFDVVTRLAKQLGWTIAHQQQGTVLLARTSDAMFKHSEIVAVQFRDRQVLVASICAPEIGYSLVGRRRCQQHRERVLAAVSRLPSA